ncbi:MAG: glycosyltransferase family 9 protein [Planctomycetes bacterium]|nr:glycosyltransferase family 9 protein [Planctomycetota bacterium]
MDPRDRDCKAIVVRLPNWVGDVVMATPLLRAVRGAAPHAAITAVGTPAAGRLLQGSPFFDRYQALDRRGRHGGWLGWWKAGRDLAAGGRPDLHLLLPHSLSSALVAKASGARCVAGYWTRERGLLLDVKPRPAMEGRRRLPIPMTRLYLDLLRALGPDARDERLALSISADERARAAVELARLGVADDEPFAAVNPGAAFGASKFWTVEEFAATVRGLAERQRLRTLILCGPGEEALARSIAQAAGAAAIDTSAAPIALELLKPVLQRARLLVTTDTGPRHVATAVGTPCVVVMGPTDPRHTASNLERTRVLRVDVPCGPCHLKVCPLDHRCMTSLTAEMALRAAAELLALPPAA